MKKFLIVICFLSFPLHACNYEGCVERVALLFEWQFNTIRERFIYLRAPDYYPKWIKRFNSTMKEHDDIVDNGCDNCRKKVKAQCLFRIEYIKICLGLKKSTGDFYDD